MRDILMVVPYKNTFILSDIELLSIEYSVVLNEYNWRNKALTPYYLFRQFLFLLFNIKKFKAILVQFGGYWSLLPSFIGHLFGKPVFIILHGTDCASIPPINYGSLRKKLLRLVCKCSYQFATMLLPVSDSLINTQNSYIENGNRQGVLYHFPKLNTPIQTIHNGLDINYWSPSREVLKEENRFIAVFSENQFVLKGGDLIIEVASKFPEYHFRIAGLTKPMHLKVVPSNVFFLGKLTQEELREEYRKSQYHLQLSMYEGFGLALCEAMLCECIPIGSAVNIIPEIIGDSGFVLETKHSDQLIDLINQALRHPDKDQLRQRARTRIVNRFKLTNRKKRMISLLNSYIS